jgi:hypothetical protein
LHGRLLRLGGAPHSDRATRFTAVHRIFGQLAGLVGAPAAYLRQLPAALAGINLQYGLTTHRAEQVKSLETDTGRLELRAMTGPNTAASTTMSLSPP